MQIKNDRRRAEHEKREQLRSSTNQDTSQTQASHGVTTGTDEPIDLDLGRVKESTVGVAFQRVGEQFGNRKMFDIVMERRAAYEAAERQRT